MTRETAATASGSQPLGTHAPAMKDSAMPPILATAFAALRPRPICPMRKPTATATSA